MLHLNNRTINKWRGRGGESILSYFENSKKYPDFGKICPDCVHLSVKFPIENAVLRVSG